MTQEINIQEISQKLYDKVKDKGWNKLRTFLLSSDMDDIFEKLVKEVEQGKRFTPPVKSLFTALEKCPLDSVKVVIIGQDPYPQLGVADGIAFSCSNTGKIEKSLQYMHNSIVETVDAEYVGSPDLSNWAEQGVLMLNSALTTTIGKPGTHQELWQPFMAYLLDILAHYKNDLVYVFLGKKAQEFADMVPDSNHKIMVSHPASAAYSGSKWDCNDMWNQINNYLDEKGKQPISW
jgi:uracil-DNA glycosylase